MTMGSVVAATALAAASTAWACTEIMGRMTVSPTAGGPGTVISASASGLKAAPARYKLLFSDAKRVSAQLTCMTSRQVIKKGIHTDSTGSFTTQAKIPLTAPQGVSQVCGLETYPAGGQTGTTHETFTVT